LEKSWGVRLPAALRELLLFRGKYSGMNFFQNEYHLDILPELWTLIRNELKQKNLGFAYDANIFPFAFFDQYGQFWFFKLDECDDPPVYTYIMYSEHPHVTRQNEKLTDCIKDQDWYKMRIS
jgi:hypothetical protein